MWLVRSQADLSLIHLVLTVFMALLGCCSSGSRNASGLIPEKISFTQRVSIQGKYSMGTSHTHFNDIAF